MTTKLTARDAGKWRRSDEEITTLARRMLTREVMVINDERAIRDGFMLVLALVEMTPAAAKSIGALIGDLNETTRMACNGTPIFTSMGFLHKDDMARFFAEVDRMRAALGIDYQLAD